MFKFTMLKWLEEEKEKQEGIYINAEDAADTIKMTIAEDKIDILDELISTLSGYLIQ